MITIIGLLAFVAAITASVPSIYFFRKFYSRNKFYSMMSLSLGMTFILHGFYHLLIGFEELTLLAEILETVAALLVLNYTILYSSNGGNNNL